MFFVLLTLLKNHTTITTITNIYKITACYYCYRCYYITLRFDMFVLYNYCCSLCSTIIIITIVLGGWGRLHFNNIPEFVVICRIDKDKKGLLNIKAYTKYASNILMCNTK